MNTLTVLASPRVDGNTERILQWIEGALRQGQHQVERVHINPLDVRDCVACLACAESADEPGCAIRDDVPRIFEKLIEADAVVFASPLYMWGVSGPMKSLYDRTLCLVRGWGTPEHRSFVDGTRIAQLITCAGGDGENTEPVTTCFERLAYFLKADSRGTLVFPNCTEPEELPDTHGTKAREFAERLVA